MSACCPPPGWHPLPPTPVALPTRPVPRRGAHDRVIPVRTQEQGSTATPGSWLVVVPNAGHVVLYQHPRQWAQQVLRFLDTAKEVGAVLQPLRCACWAVPAIPAVLACALLPWHQARTGASAPCRCLPPTPLRAALHARQALPRALPPPRWQELSGSGQASS